MCLLKVPVLQIFIHQTGNVTDLTHCPFARVQPIRQQTYIFFHLSSNYKFSNKNVFACEVSGGSTIFFHIPYNRKVFSSVYSHVRGRIAGL